MASGIDGVLVLDLPPDEDPGILPSLRDAGLATVCLATPNTRDDRKSFLAAESRGFMYYVCRLGVTGERDSLTRRSPCPGSARLRGDGSVPVCIGFGISNPEQAAEAATYGDGVIVGSHPGKSHRRTRQESRWGRTGGKSCARIVCGGARGCSRFLVA